MKVSVHEDELRLLAGQWRAASERARGCGYEATANALDGCICELLLAIAMARDVEMAKVVLSSQSLTTKNEDAKGGE